MKKLLTPTEFRSLCFETDDLMFYSIYCAIYSLGFLNDGLRNSTASSISRISECSPSFFGGVSSVQFEHYFSLIFD